MFRGDVVNPVIDLRILARDNHHGTYHDADGLLWHAVPVQVVGRAFSRHSRKPVAWTSQDEYTLAYRVVEV